jgi:hypothetical protein
MYQPRGNVYSQSQQSQQLKLATMLDFYEADSTLEYRLLVDHNCVRTMIGHEQSISSERESDSSNSVVSMRSGRDSAKKGAGLFANIIKNMKENRIHAQSRGEQSEQQRQPFMLYANQLKAKDASPACRPASTKKVKDRVTAGMSHLSSFKNVEIKPRLSENTNFLNSQLNN